jgi:hypothetical protein
MFRGAVGNVEDEVGDRSPFKEKEAGRESKLDELHCLITQFLK